MDPIEKKQQSEQKCPPVFQFEGISFAYAGSPKVLEDVHFEIRPGERVGLIGANGAGKSTLMKLAVGLLPAPAEGRITVCGTEVTPPNLPRIRRQIGYVLQNSDNQMFMPTVLEDMIFGLQNDGVSRPDAVRKAEQILTDLDCLYLKDRHNHRISGGEKRMAAIATVLMTDPAILMLDEPSASLDPGNRRKVINLLNRLPQTLIIASHDLDFILETCDRVLLLSDGRIASDAAAFSVLSSKELLESNHLELPFCMTTPQRRA